MKFLPGIAVGAASGSMGGVTASHNRGGQYFRRRAVPSNPLSPYSAEARNRLASLSAGWRALTAVQQQAWIDATESVSVVNPLGSTVHLTGQQLYIRANQRLALYDPGSMMVVPPASWDVPLLTSIAITTLTVDALALDEFEVTMDPATQPVQSTTVIRVTPPLQLGIQNARKYLRTLGVFTPTAGVIDLAAAYIARFGSAMDAGNRIFVEAAILSTTNGQVSPYLLTSALTESA